MAEKRDPELPVTTEELALPTVLEIHDDLPDEPGQDLVLSDPLQQYFAAMRRYPLLSPEEEHDFAVQYKEYGDIQAAYRLVTGNLRLVVKLAREYQHASEQLLELIQEGNTGLMEAVQKFDPYRGVRFPSYAAWWIRAYMLRFLMRNFRLIRIGTTRAQRKLFYNLRKEKAKIEAEGFVPSPKLIAHRLDVSEGEVIDMEQRLAAPETSLDTRLNNAEHGATLGDMVADSSASPERMVEAAHDQKLIQQQIAAFAEQLTGRDKVIFEQRLIADEPRTLQEIADEYELSRERVRQIENQIKKKLKAHLLDVFEDADALAISFNDE